jgi:hypothetical protein
VDDGVGAWIPSSALPPTSRTEGCTAVLVNPESFKGDIVDGAWECGKGGGERGKSVHCRMKQSPVWHSYPRIGHPWGPKKPAGMGGIREPQDAAKAGMVPCKASYFC